VKLKNAKLKNNRAAVDVLRSRDPGRQIIDVPTSPIAPVPETTVLPTISVQPCAQVHAHRNWADRVDDVLTHPILGAPIFLGIMYVIFQSTFTAAEPMTRLLEQIFAFLARETTAYWPAWMGPWGRSLVVDGIIGGVGGVLVFVPNVLLLFLGIALLEDTGYMARASSMTEHIMLRGGLHGRSFVPMVIGFDCSVPAILATRFIEDKKSRLITILVLPLISCSARYSIYAMIIPAFFAPAWRGPMLMLIYGVGVLLAIAAAKVLSTTLIKTGTTNFMGSLPAYTWPSPGRVGRQIWERAWLCVRKAGTVTLLASIVLWAATRYPSVDGAAVTGHVQQQQLANSLVGRAGHVLEYALKPLGFDWKISTAMVSAFAGKEIFVSQMAILHSSGAAQAGMETLRQHLRQNYGALVGLCVMLFSLVSMPCIGTIIMTRNETGSWKWAAFQMISLTVLAYVLTLAVYQIGRLLI
jgi:ferrous iron transport protein B